MQAADIDPNQGANDHDEDGDDDDDTSARAIPRYPAIRASWPFDADSCFVGVAHCTAVTGDRARLGIMLAGNNEGNVTVGTRS